MLCNRPTCTETGAALALPGTLQERDTPAPPRAGVVTLPLPIRLRSCAGRAAGPTPAAEPQPGPDNLSHIVRKRLRIQGFIVSDHADRREAFLADMRRWLGEGEVRSRQTIVEGLERAPEAFLGLFDGSNIGKMVVRIAGE